MVIQHGIFSITQDAYEVCDANPKIKHDKQLALLKKTAPPGKTESFITKCINVDSWLVKSEHKRAQMLCQRNKGH